MRSDNAFVAACSCAFSRPSSSFLVGSNFGLRPSLDTLRRRNPWWMSRQKRVMAALRQQNEPGVALPLSRADEAAAKQERRKRRPMSVTRKDNSRSDRFRMKKFHHVEFYCGDATAAASRFIWGLGMSIVAKSDQSTGNAEHASYVLQSRGLRFVCTAPYSTKADSERSEQNEQIKRSRGSPLPGFNGNFAHDFFRKHGFAARAIGIEVEDAEEAYRRCVENGGIGVQSPARVTDARGRGTVTMAEVHAYGDVVLRLISFDSCTTATGGEAIGNAGREFSGNFLPNFDDVRGGQGPCEDFGLQRADHIVGNVWDMFETVDYLAEMTGMHEFAEFAAADVGTVDSGLNSMVLASDNEMVLLPLNEPTFGTAKKSQIQTFLEQNNGPGLQHMALKTNDIFKTMRLIRANSHLGGFEFQEPPGPAYYRGVRERIPSLSPKQLEQLEELGLLADTDDEGVLLQVFTKPVGDRPTLFFEVIQRIGCEFEASPDDSEGDRVESDDAVGVRAAETGETLQRGGCGGFGLGNFKALFESIEKYESTLAVGTDSKARNPGCAPDADQ